MVSGRRADRDERPCQHSTCCCEAVSVTVFDAESTAASAMYVCCRNIIRSLRVSVAQILSICRLRNVFLDYSRVSDLHLHEAVDYAIGCIIEDQKYSKFLTADLQAILLKIRANENVAGIIHARVI